MIPGLNLDPEAEARLWSAFSAWSDHFRRELSEGGVPWLLERYAEVVASVESRSCAHGPGGTRLTGEAWQYCCGISYEYWNDITVRTALDVIIDFSPADSSASWRARVEALDERLYALYSNGPSRRSFRWWYEGLPDGVLE